MYPRALLDAVLKIILLPLPEIELRVLITANNFLIRELFPASASTPYDLTSKSSTERYAIPTLRFEIGTLWVFPRASLWRK
jgi:hypothetical protein